MEKTMDQASSLFVRPDRRRPDAIALPTVVIRFAVAPRTTLSWRAPRDAEVRAHGAPLWITRPPSVDDYWVQPGDVLRVARGERIWLSADDDRPAEASITTAYVPGGDRLRRALALTRRLLVGRWRTLEARE
ncbi:DUF2917 domain-containing protein [Burkholderia multivorans]|uniref:DUF2917 domain-containing protein n=1 Tax=Burkholderia multivorans TaxID=87883 RepID=A0A2S9N078_9BURK|nr:DUF2917 domain-containing protein [Burkholderia multivorans]MBR7895654.1 DUF2917 domain-containing protein [Burkholderia multivorans]MBU9512251.1 DUF2917 domain-containing protein [Burkholderia multivorans]MBU9528348.1 DUF2917 domain-containing protein [Burkholderia multivorans]MBU9539089.1 DUF2917 domain-containing protein [Burkholderia multivorans]MBU9634005.1 DUF2917 domain-containing protein [Burkholderia multivorans]